MCVFIRPNTLLLCIFLFFIFLLYPTDSHVEVQIRILLKNKYKKSCQKCKHLQSHFDFLKNAYPVFFFFEKQLASQNNFLLLCVAFFLCMDLQPYSHDCYLKISETILIGFFILEKKLANIPLFLFLIHSLHVGWRNLFSSCAVVLCQFLVLAGNRFWFTYSCRYLEYNVVSVFWL